MRGPSVASAMECRWTRGHSPAPSSSLSTASCLTESLRVLAKSLVQRTLSSEPALASESLSSPCHSLYTRATCAVRS